MIKPGKTKGIRIQRSDIKKVMDIASTLQIQKRIKNISHRKLRLDQDPAGKWLLLKNLLNNVPTVLQINEGC